MAKTVNRRDVRFGSFEEVQAEVMRLLESGYRSTGNWTLGQACFHLAEWARFPMDGFPKPPWWIRAIFGVLKMTGQAERMKQKILSSGFRAGTPTAPQTAPMADSVSDEAGVKKLCEVIERIRTYRGPLHASPLFGPMDRDVWIQVNLLHCQHHLGFLAPN